MTEKKSKKLIKNVKIILPDGEIIAEGKPSRGKILVAKSFYKGPIPPASEMKRYYDLNPKYTDEIFKQFKEEGKFKREFNKKGLKAQISFDKRAQYFPFFIILLLVVFSCFVFIKGSVLLASALVSPAILIPLVNLLKKK